MRCIAIDDEPMALNIISQYCARIGGIELTTFSDPIKGIEQVKSTYPDLLFLDIEMGVANGIEIARSIPSDIKIIFTTAYAQFAIDGFELNAVDFLHKPFSFTRFERAIEKFRQVINYSNRETEDNITVKVEYQNVKLPLSSIIYIEAMDNYVKINTINSRTTLSQMSMKAIEELLPSDTFFRVHKSFIVARSAIESYNKSVITLKYKQTQIPIGRTYQNSFIEWII